MGIRQKIKDFQAQAIDRDKGLDNVGKIDTARARILLLQGALEELEARVDALEAKQK